MLVNSRYWIFWNVWFVVGYDYNKFFFYFFVILVEWIKYWGIIIFFNCLSELKLIDVFFY